MAEDTILVEYLGPAKIFNGKPRGAQHKLTAPQIAQLVQPAHGGHRFKAMGKEKLPEPPAPTQGLSQTEEKAKN